MNPNNCEYKSWYADKLKKKVDELDDFDIHCVNVIKEYLKNKVWDGSEMQYSCPDYISWLPCSNGQEYRIKPQPDYTKEIEALEQKAKENGQKVTIKFE